MGYHIEYQTAQKKCSYKSFPLRLPALIILCFLLFLFLVNTIWNDGAAWMQKNVFRAGSAIAVSALDDLADELGYGEMVMSAFSDFCRKLIS